MKLTMKWSLLAMLALGAGVAACSKKEDAPGPMEEPDAPIVATCDAATAAGAVTYVKVDSSLAAGVTFNSGIGFNAVFSGNGQIMAIAEEGYDTTGRIHVYKRVDNKWQPVAKLIGQGGRATLNGGDLDIMQGSSLAISMDGGTIAFGGWQNEGYRGGVWVFESNADKTVWTQKALIKPSDTQYTDRIALSDNGKHILISGNGGGRKAYLYSQSAGWTETGSFEFQGATYVRSSAVSCQGDFVAMQVVMSSAPNEYTVHVFRKVEGTGWLPAGVGLKPNGAVNGNFFGRNGSFSGDGKRLILGASAQTINGNRSGAAWVYEFNGTSFQPLGGMLGGQNFGSAEMGRKVQLSKDGKLAVIMGNADVRGIIAVYQEQSGQWLEKQVIQGKGTEDFLVSVDITPDGSRLLVVATKSGVPTGFTYKRN